MDSETLRYPIGRFRAPDEIDAARIDTWIDEIESFPARLRAVVGDLPPDVLDTPYRPGGWTVRQVVHHLADSHLHSIIRFKWTLTEDTPTIKAYFEDRWAELADSRAPIDTSLDLLEALHARWVVLLRGLDAEELDRAFHHPESDTRVRLRENVGIYAWHGRHHLAHVERLLERLERGDDAPRG